MSGCGQRNDQAQVTYNKWETETNGNYSLNAGNGTWTVGVNLGGCGDCLPDSYLCPLTQSVVISNNNGTANFTALLATNDITGDLKANTGNPIVGVRVFANDTIGGVFYQSREDTDTNGYYTVNVGNGTWSVGVYCSGPDSDTLDAVLGAGNYICPASQNVAISNNNGTANFTVQLSSFPALQVTTTSDQRHAKCFLQHDTHGHWRPAALHLGAAARVRPVCLWVCLWPPTASFPAPPSGSGTSEFIVEVTDATTRGITNSWPSRSTLPPSRR